MADTKHILGMEPENVARQMIRARLAHKPADTDGMTVADCLALMLEFNQWLVSTNETLQKLVLDKINTELPRPIIVAKRRGE